MVRVKEATLSPCALHTPAYKAGPKILQGNLKNNSQEFGGFLTELRFTKSYNKYKTLTKLREYYNGIITQMFFLPGIYFIEYIRNYVKSLHIRKLSLGEYTNKLPAPSTQ